MLSIVLLLLWFILLWWAVYKTLEPLNWDPEILLFSGYVISSLLTVAAAEVMINKRIIK